MKEPDMVTYYSERAGEYEQIYFRDNPVRRKELQDEAARLEVLTKGKSILELACGTGYWTEVMSRTARKILATDISDEMILEAKKKGFGSTVTFRKLDLYNLPDMPERFDLVALGFWFSHHPRQSFDQLFSILTRFLTPGGEIWLIDNNPPAEGPTNDSVGGDTHGNNYKRRLLSDGREFTILKNYFERDELTQILAKSLAVSKLVYGTYYWSAILKDRTHTLAG